MLAQRLEAGPGGGSLKVPGYEQGYKHVVDVQEDQGMS
jgi:hypothetical protein